MTRPRRHPTGKNGPLTVPRDGAEKNFAIAKRGANRSRLGVGPSAHGTNSAARVRATTTTACSSRIAIGRRGIAIVCRTRGNGAPRPARASRAPVIAIGGIGFATVKPKNRARNTLQQTLGRMARMSGIAIAANDRANGNRMANQNGVRATRIESFDALTFSRDAIATAASTIHPQRICGSAGTPMPPGLRLRARISHTATDLRWVASASTSLRSMSKAVLLNSKS
jgi:hypothetical protein